MALFSSIIIVDRNYCILVAEYTSPISGKKRQIPSPIEFLGAISDYYQTLPSWTGPRRTGLANLPTDYRREELLAAGQVPGGLPSDYKETELEAGLAAQKFRYGAGLPGQQNLVFGTDASGNVDRSQSDEYKSQMAQYRNLIAKEKQQEAKDLGMEIWKQKYADTAMAQPGGAIGSYNPLLAKMFPETRGYAGTFAPIEEIQKGDLGTRAQGEGGWTLESLNPEAQQEATAAQAQMATTAGMPVLSPRERAQLLIRSI